jgi:type I pantothenate kinase
MTGLADVSALIRARAGGRAPCIVGVTGAVAVGKSHFAGALAAAIATWPESPVVEVVSTDGFLFPNAVLEGRGLLNRKGFPDTYDADALRGALAGIRVGPADMPAYSHTRYDVDLALTRRLDPPGVLIVEGLGLQDGAVSLGLDALIYLDADETDIEAWFEQRFIDLWRAAEHDPASFYARFRQMNETETRAVAGQVWRAINLPNLREHIVRGRDVADIVVRKGPDHAILDVTERAPGSL